MPLTLTLSDIAWRLTSAFIASALIGFNRGEHGHSAGLRTTILVCIAAALSMLQANALLDLTGKEQQSFIVMDLMRLPLGVLSGIGFIGAGAILRKENMVTGVTTAATMWFVTIIGLNFGGGQLTLGWIGTGIILFVLSSLRNFEHRFKQERRGILAIQIHPQSISEETLRERILQSGFKIKSIKISYLNADKDTDKKTQIEWTVAWSAKEDNVAPPPLIKEFTSSSDIYMVEWRP